MIYLVAACLIAIWCHIAVANWRVMVSKSTMWRNSSLIPMVGGFFGAAGFALVPALRPWAWVPILLDPGTAMLPVALPYLLRDFWQTSRFNLVTEYAGRRDNRTVRLALYRRNVGTLVQRIDRPPDEFGWTERSMSGSWRWKGDRLELNIGGRVAIFEHVPGAPEGTIRQRRVFRPRSPTRTYHWRGSTWWADRTTPITR